MSSLTAILIGKHTKPVSRPVRMCEGIGGGGTYVDSPFVLAVRLYWGWPFAQTG
jgi:hypothetical protein